MDTGLRATPRARVLTVLELALEELELADEPILEPGDEHIGRTLRALLTVLGVPAEVTVEGLPLDRQGAADQLVEAEQHRRDLDTRGRDALDLDDVPRGVSIAGLLDDERERAYGEVDRLVEAIAATLPA